MPRAFGYIQVEDYDKEQSTVNINLQDIEVNGSNYSSLAQDLDEINDAVVFLTRGKVRQLKVSTQYDEDQATVTDKEAAREAKWLVTYRDTTLNLGLGISNPGYGKVFTLEIPCANRSLLPDGGTDELDITIQAVQDNVIAKLQPNIRSPYNRAAGAGYNPTNEILSIRYVGRNL